MKKRYKEIEKEEGDGQRWCEWVRETERQAQRHKNRKTETVRRFLKEMHWQN
jgi:hypothetical protein